MDTYQCNAPHDTLEFSTSDIPEYIRKLAALAAIELTESILRQPDGRRMLAEELRGANQWRAKPQELKGGDFL